MKNHRGLFQKGHKNSEESEKKRKISLKGRKVWNTGIKTGIVPKTAFKKGHTPWHKGKKIPEKMIKEGYGNWHNNKMAEYPELERIRKSKEYILWQKACLVRDNFTCQKTGVRGGRLEVHHINNFSEFPELRLSIDNGITLLDKVHKEFHHIYGIKNNTREQLLEFLS